MEGEEVGPDEGERREVDPEHPDAVDVELVGPEVRVHGHRVGHQVVPAGEQLEVSVLELVRVIGLEVGEGVVFLT